MKEAKKVKVGNLQMKEYATQKPITIAPDGKLVTTLEVASTPSLAIGSLGALGEDLQIQLTVERNKLEPDYKLGIAGVGIVTKDEVIQHVESRTLFGQEAVRAEVNYCNELMATLASPVAEWPATTEVTLESVPKEWSWIPNETWKKWIPFFRMCSLFCENTTDAVTKYAAAYRKKNVHPVFRARGFRVLVLEGTNDIRAKFAPLAKNKRVVYVSGIGHGSPTVYTGHLSDPILRKCSYDQAEVRGKIFHLLSCQTAKELGADLVKKGAKAYAGYFENFVFVYDQPGTPIDEMELFWKCDSTFDVMMARGLTVEQAHKITISAYNAAIAAVPGTAAATWLTHDRNYLRSPVTDAIYGGKKAKISPFIAAPLSPFMEIEEAFPELVREG